MFRWCAEVTDSMAAAQRCCWSEPCFKILWLSGVCCSVVVLSSSFAFSALSVCVCLLTAMGCLGWWDDAPARMVKKVKAQVRPHMRVGHFGLHHDSDMSSITMNVRCVVMGCRYIPDIRAQRRPVYPHGVPPYPPPTLGERGRACVRARVGLSDVPSCYVTGV